LRKDEKREDMKIKVTLKAGNKTRSYECTLDDDYDVYEPYYEPDVYSGMEIDWRETTNE